MKKILLLSGFLAIPALAHADCAEQLVTWAAALAPGRALDAEHAVCKIWPVNPKLTLAALPLPQPGATEEGGAGDLLVLVADSASGAVLSHLLEPSVINYGDIGLTALTLDTARYQLTAADRAFGVRVRNELVSQHHPVQQTALSLYLVDGPALRKVLDRRNVSSYVVLWQDICNGELHRSASTIDVGPMEQTGYAALIVSQKSEETIQSKCDGSDKPTQRTKTTLRYKDGHYQ